MDKFLNILSRPSVSIVLRKIVELNFRAQKNIIGRYLIVERGDQALDLGCGTGEFSSLFPAESYTGIDIDERNINYAKTHYQRKFLTADARKLPFGGNSFDKILIFGVLHHLNDADFLRVLEEAGRILKPEGKILAMEDVDDPANGYFTNLVHRFDQGKFIRTEEEYRKLLNSRFNITDNFAMQSGLCSYRIFLLSKA